MDQWDHWVGDCKQNIRKKSMSDIYFKTYFILIFNAILFLKAHKIGSCKIITVSMGINLQNV